MDPKLIKQYKERFKVLRKFEKVESKKLSLQEKFKQLASVFSSNIGQLIDLSQKRKMLSLKSNWATLKR